MKIETGNGQAREGEGDRVGERQSGKRMKEPFFFASNASATRGLGAKPKRIQANNCNCN